MSSPSRLRSPRLRCRKHRRRRDLRLLKLLRRLRPARASGITANPREAITRTSASARRGGARFLPRRLAKVRTTARVGLIALAALFAADEACAQIGGGGFPGGGSAGRRGGIRGGTERQPPRIQDEPRQDAFQTTLEELRIDL